MGVASGAIALDTDAVKRLTAAGKPAILVRHDTSTADIEGMALAAASSPPQADEPPMRPWLRGN